MNHQLANASEFFPDVTGTPARQVIAISSRRKQMGYVERRAAHNEYQCSTPGQTERALWGVARFIRRGRAARSASDVSAEWQPITSRLLGSKVSDVLPKHQKCT